MAQTPRAEVWGSGREQGLPWSHSPAMPGWSATRWCQRNPPGEPGCAPRLWPHAFGLLGVPPVPPQGPRLLGPLAQPRSSGRAYLDAPDDSMVHPAHVGQGWALHQDFHGLDGTRWAEVVHGHLGQQVHPHCNHSQAGEGARAAPGPFPMGTELPKRLSSSIPTPCTPSQPISSAVRYWQMQETRCQPSWAHQTPCPAPPRGICPQPGPGGHQLTPTPSASAGNGS